MAANPFPAGTHPAASGADSSALPGRAGSLAAPAPALPTASVGARPANGDAQVSLLAQSQLWQDFRQAFAETTGLPVALQPAGSWQLPHRGTPQENPFCALMAERSRTCVACLRSHDRLWQAAMQGAKVMTCTYGLCELAVPVRADGAVIGFLHCGQAFRRPPSPACFERVGRLIARAAPDLDLALVRARWLGTPVVPAPRWDSLAVLLRVFAEHLALAARQWTLLAGQGEPPAIRRAREFVAAHYGERLSLSVVARAVHTSPFYFCKLFKRVSGENFTRYLARLRVEKAKNLLLNPNLKISEIAFEVGFQSLTHFNRTFRRLTGRAPSEYRQQLPRPGPAT